MVVLSSIPTPSVVEEISYEAIVQRQKDKFQELWEAVRVSYPELPDYDVSMLETDPAMIIIEAESYRELLMRARTNDAARANLLRWATGADLDNLAADHGVVRLEGESDERLKQRIVLADQGRSTAGPEEWYEYHAMSVDIDVAEAKVYKPGAGPEISVAILSVSNGGVASPALLSDVETALTAKGVRGMNDVLSVVAAAQATVNITYNVWLLPEASEAILDTLEDVLRDAWAAEGGIGFDLLPAWITARLMVDGVSKIEVTAPAVDQICDDNSAIALGTITGTYMGRNR